MKGLEFHMSLLAGLTTDDLVEGSTQQYFTPERAKAATAAMFATLVPLDDNPQSNVEFTYDPGLGCITANVDLDPPGILSVEQDPAPTLSANLNINDHDIVGVGDVNIAGELIADALIINNLLVAEKGVIKVTNNGSLFVDHITTDNFVTQDIIAHGDATVTGNVLIRHGDFVVQSGVTKSVGIVAQSIETSTFKGAWLGSVATDLSTPSDDEALIGTTTLPTTLKVYSKDTHAVFTGLTNTDKFNTAFYIRQSRGTLDAPTAVEPGDMILRIDSQGHDGTEFKSLSCFGVRVDAEQESSVAGEFVIATYDAERAEHYATFNSSGVFSVPVMQTGTEYPAKPAKGMIIFDDNANRFVGYNGVEWVALSNT